MIEGASLRLPAGVIKNTHNASTFQPYDPAEAIGNTAPTTPKPPKNKSNCGAGGQILLVVIAVAVAAVLTAGVAGVIGGQGFAGGLAAAANGTSIAAIAGGVGVTTGATASAALGFAAGAIGGAVGSIASQAVGVATGIQDKFSWTAVASAALGGGLGGAGKLGVGGWSPGSVAARAAVSNTLAQSLSIALGPQSKFDFVSVAAAAAGAGARSLSSGFARDVGHGIASGRAAFAIAQGVGGAASAIASAASGSALDGSSFGDGIVAAIPDVIGQTIGNFISACFVGDTLNHTPNGLKRIDEIKVGDWVFARDEHFGSDLIHRKQVTELFRFENRATLDVTIAGAGGRQVTIRTTPEHPFAIEGAGWVPAGELAEGNRTVDIEGNPGIVTLIAPVAGLSTVHNFSVADDHTYFVSELGVWVHNRYEGIEKAKADPKKQLSDFEYAESDGYIVRATQGQEASGKGRVIPLWIRAGKDLESYYDDHGLEIPNVAEAWDGDSRTVDGSPNVTRADFKYTQDYVNALAVGAAEYHDTLMGSGLRPPPLYELTSLAAKDFVFAGAGGSQVHVVAVPQSGLVPSRSFVEEYRSGAELSGRTPLPLTRSGFASWEVFGESLAGVYQTAIDDAHARYEALDSAGLGPYRNSTLPENLRAGVYVDRAATRAVTDWLKYEGMSEGRSSDIWVNRRQYDPADAANFRRADIQIRSLNWIFDGSLSNKSMSTPQMRDLQRCTGATRVDIFQPRVLGGRQTIYTEPRLPLGTGHNSSRGMYEMEPVPMPRSPAPRRGR